MQTSLLSVALKKVRVFKSVTNMTPYFCAVLAILNMKINDTLILLAISIASLITAGQAECRIIAVLPGSVILIIQIVTPEDNSEQFVTLETSMENPTQEVLDELVAGLPQGTQASIVGVVSGESEILTPEATVPSPVRNVVATFPSSPCSLTVSVSWDAPSSNGGATITDYVGSCSSATAPSVVFQTNNRTFAAVPGMALVPGNTYTCEVRALNARGFSDATQSSTFDVR